MYSLNSLSLSLSTHTHTHSTLYSSALIDFPWELQLLLLEKCLKDTYVFLSSCQQYRFQIKTLFGGESSKKWYIKIKCHYKFSKNKNNTTVSLNVKTIYISIKIRWAIRFDIKIHIEQQYSVSINYLRWKCLMIFFERNFLCHVIWLYYHGKMRSNILSSIFHFLSLRNLNYTFLPVQGIIMSIWQI